MIENTTLTLDEKNSLRLWFRQAIAHVEMEEAKANMLKLYPPGKNTSHRISPARKRSTRNMQSTHTREFAY